MILHAACYDDDMTSFGKGFPKLVKSKGEGFSQLNLQSCISDQVGGH